MKKQRLSSISYKIGNAVGYIQIHHDIRPLCQFDWHALHKNSLMLSQEEFQAKHVSRISWCI